MAHAIQATEHGCGSGSEFVERANGAHEKGAIRSGALSAERGCQTSKGPANRPLSCVTAG